MTITWETPFAQGGPDLIYVIKYGDKLEKTNKKTFKIGTSTQDTSYTVKVTSYLYICIFIVIKKSYVKIVNTFNHEKWPQLLREILNFIFGLFLSLNGWNCKQKWYQQGVCLLLIKQLAYHRFSVNCKYFLNFNNSYYYYSIFLLFHWYSCDLPELTFYVHMIYMNRMCFFFYESFVSTFYVGKIYQCFISKIGGSSIQEITF